MSRVVEGVDSAAIVGFRLVMGARGSRAIGHDALRALVLAAVAGGSLGANCWPPPQGPDPGRAADACPQPLPDPAETTANVFQPDRLKQVTACVTVEGTVLGAFRESDGDWHINIAPDARYSNLLNQGNLAQPFNTLVAEIVPADQPGCTPGEAPNVPTAPPCNPTDPSCHPDPAELPLCSPNEHCARAPDGSLLRGPDGSPICTRGPDLSCTPNPAPTTGRCTGRNLEAPHPPQRVRIAGPLVEDSGHTPPWREIHPVWVIRLL